MFKRPYHILAVLFFVGSLVLSSSGTYRAGAQADEPVVGVPGQSLEPAITADSYGYTVSNPPVVTYPITSLGTPVVVSQGTNDDGYSAKINLGFSFPFYENTYSQVKISTNGYLTFDVDESEQLIGNLKIPSDQKPNNLVAPFWDDLIHGAGAAYYYQGNDGAQNYFGVQWDQFSQFNETPLVTFQAILFQNGNILFQYLSMNGILNEATVGIEDGDGVDGFQYFYNETGISSNTALLFTRPPAGSRVKLSPLYAGGFIIGGKAHFDLHLTNTGNDPSYPVDNYAFSYLPGAAGWQVKFFLQGQEVLSSGSLAQSQSQEYQVVVYPPDNAQVGDNALISLKATSSNPLSRSATVRVQVAVPAKFMHAYSDLGGMHLGLYWKENVAGTTFSPFEYNVALAPAGEKYVLLWDVRSGGLANLDYVFVNELGVPDPTPTHLEIDNGVDDRFPSLASGFGENHKVAVVWPRYIFDPELNTIYNLMFAVLDPEGTGFLGPEQVTTNTTPFEVPGGGDQIQNASVVWVDADKLWLVWQEQHLPLVGPTETGIKARLFSLSANGWISPEMHWTPDDPQVDYADPALQRLPDGTVLAFFSGVNYSQKTQQIYWVALGAGGSASSSEMPLGTLEGRRLDVTMIAGQLMLARISPDRGAVGYNLIAYAGSGTGVNLTPGTTQNLILENLNLVDYVSLFADQDNNGILTWRNTDQSQMYYALVDSSGILRTPALMFFEDPQSSILVSKNGQSSTIYVGSYKVALPILFKQR